MAMNQFGGKYFSAIAASFNKRLDRGSLCDHDLTLSVMHLLATEQLSAKGKGAGYEHSQRTKNAPQLGGLQSTN